VKVSIILGHPSSGSFNHAIVAVAAETLRARGVIVTVHDLYAEQFDPVYPRPNSRVMLRCRR